mgnify:CR=1 FL=1
MILWEVYDADDMYQNKKKFFTSLRPAVMYLIEIVSGLTQDIWSEPCVRAWAADYDGDQYLAFFTNGGLVKKIRDKPHLGNTELYMRKEVDRIIARRHIVFQEEEEDDCQDI